jgi:uncharacterized protein (DUF1501 family)
MLDPDISTHDALRHLVRTEEPTPAALDRRRFLQLVGMGLGAGLVAGSGGSLLDVAFGHDPSTWAAGPVGPTDGILVVLGMYGGNDGLNTVVPTNDGQYVAMHGPLAVPAGSTLPITGDRGLHPRLTRLKQFWDAGQLAVVEGIGYPNPDLSHFNSMAYWMSGRPNQAAGSGWLGRWLDGHLAGGPDLYAAAEIGNAVPLHLLGASRRGTVVAAGPPGYGSEHGDEFLRQYAAIRRMRDAAPGGWGGPVGQALVDQLDLARNLAPIMPASLPQPEIVGRLEVAARLINANLGFRVLTAGWHDFDSHAGQPGLHDVRMTELNAAITRFFEVLDPAWGTRVTLMTFSEFGRTPWSNDGAGTDHGTSAPHFVIGRNVRGGLHGARPTLAGLGRWDRMAHHVDMRSYYASILDGWMGGGSSTVLGGNFEDLGLFARGPGREPDGSITPIPTIGSAPSDVHPISPARVLDARIGLGAAARKLGPGEAVRVKVTDVAGVPAAGVTAVIANVTAVEPTTKMHFTVYPGSTPRPETSNLNGGPGRPVPNLVVMAVGSDGCIEVANSHGETHCLVDLFGYASTTGGSRFRPTDPARLFDTRNGDGIRPGLFLPGQPLEIGVAGRAGVPASGATAVAMNLTAVAPSSAGHLRVTPSGKAPAETSNVNFGPGDTVPNMVVCELGANGALTIDAAVAATHVVGDIFGYFSADGDRLVTMSPRRLLDTRNGTGAPKAQLQPNGSVNLAVGGVGGVPSTATAAVLNVTAVNVAAASHVTVWPAGTSEAATSNLNLQPGLTIANLVVCRIGQGGAVSMRNPIASCDLVADVLGYFVP